MNSNNGSPDSRYASNSRMDNAEMPAAGQKRSGTVKFQM
jgi:hypothetical protein